MPKKCIDLSEPPLLEKLAPLMTEIKLVIDQTCFLLADSKSICKVFTKHEHIICLYFEFREYKSISGFRTIFVVRFGGRSARTILKDYYECS